MLKTLSHFKPSTFYYSIEVINNIGQKKLFALSNSIEAINTYRTLCLYYVIK